MKRMTEASAMLLLAWVDGMIKKCEFTMDDEATYALLQRGDTDGIFFLESRYDKYNLQLLKPSCMRELTAACAMTHPLTSEKIYLYLRNKALGETEQFGIPELDECLKETNGVFLYKQQVDKGKEILSRLIAEGTEEQAKHAKIIMDSIDGKQMKWLVNYQYISKRAKLVYQMEFIKAHMPEQFEELRAKLCAEEL